MERLAETKEVKRALIEAGYTGGRVGHGRGTAWGWLHIKCDMLTGQTWQQKHTEVEAIARRVSGRHGDYGGRITIS